MAGSKRNVALKFSSLATTGDLHDQRLALAVMRAELRILLGELRRTKDDIRRSWATIQSTRVALINFETEPWCGFLERQKSILNKQTNKQTNKQDIY